MLSKEQEEIWNRYLKAEKDKIRVETLRVLADFVKALKQSKSDGYRDWVYHISEVALTEEQEIPIRMPLFREIIFPILYHDYKDGKPKSARLLAGYNQLVYQLKEFQENPDELSEIALLQAALKDDPHDEQAALKLMRALAWQIDYSVHEIPQGILYGNSSPTSEQCDELNKGLSEFELLISNFNVSEKYADLVQYARIHYTAYKSFLEVDSFTGTYEDFCEKNNIEY